MEITTHILHTAKLKSNCPECFATTGLEFTFSQEEVENKLYSKAKSKVIEQLYCHKCQQNIYPVSWTQDIEQVYKYHRKQATPRSTSVQLKPLAYILLIIDALLIGALIYYLR